LTILDVAYNIGHQKSIYQGFTYAIEKEFDNLLIMDSDGEDDPKSISKILEFNEFDLVQIHRGKRNESFYFKMAYKIFKLIHFFIIGKKIQYGNFSLVRRKLVFSALNNGFSHLGAFLDNQKCKRFKLKINRSKRIGGKSKMNFRNLFFYAINSFVENQDRLLFFQFKIFIFCLIIFIITVLVVLHKKFISSEAIPGWSSILISIFFISGLLSIGFFITGYLIKSNNTKNQQAYKKLYKVKRIIVNWE
jgi:polyisoprenyl-phosphate glycosyltransferase